jgi:hypothetical protein
MANEITIALTATLTNPSAQSGSTPQLKDSQVLAAANFTQATQLMFSEAITCTTSDTLISFTGVTTQGWCILQNLDATNYVGVGPNNAGAILTFIRLVPNGGRAVFQLDPSVGFRIQANTASCKVRITVYNT